MAVPSMVTSEPVVAAPVSVRAGFKVTDGFSCELRDLALGLVLQLSGEERLREGESAGSAASTGGLTTFRLARQDDVDLVCDCRCAQSIEYGGVEPSEAAYRLFRAETEAYVCRNLNKRVFFALIEYDGAAVSVSGLEVVDRLPAINAQGGSEHAATVVACYTLPAHRGQGHMRQMLDAWSAIAPLLGIDVLYLESRNASMQRLALDGSFEYASEKFCLTVSGSGVIQDDSDSPAPFGAVREPAPAFCGIG